MFLLSPHSRTERLEIDIAGQKTSPSMSPRRRISVVEEAPVLRAKDLLDAHDCLVGKLPHRATACTRPATAAAPP
jgi:hypothetical protein